MSTIIHINRDVLEQIQNTIGTFPAESGGTIFSNEQGTIEAYYFDKQASIGQVIYQPSSKDIEAVDRELRKSGLLFSGFIHSHTGCSKPSQQDLESARAVLRANDELVNILLGIAVPCLHILRFFRVTDDTCDELSIAP